MARMHKTQRMAVRALLLLVLLLEPCEAENAVVNWVLKIAGLRAEEPRVPNPQPLKVFSAGLSRTGTMSLKAGMEQLGYKTFHGADGMAEKETVGALNHAYMTGDSSLFLDILERDGFNASVEFMVFPVVRDAVARYPDARVILSVRDSAEKWAASWIEIGKVLTHTEYGPVGLLFRTLGLQEPFAKVACASFAWLVSAGSASPAAVAEECGSPEAVATSRMMQVREPDREAEAPALFARAYEAYNAAVREAVPPERLLEFNVKQGYGPLCLFLGVPEGACPAEFPHVNDAAEMRMAGRAFAAVRYGWWVPIPLFLLCVLRCRARKPCKAPKSD